MCQTIVIGEKEIETPGEFEQQFGFPGIAEPYFNTIDLDACLCQIDIEQTFWLHDVVFEYVPEDMCYYIKS